MSAKIIAITGGIGSGKSVISRVLRIRNYIVIDTDSLAKEIMDSDNEIHKRISKEISEDAICNGIINRAHLAQIVFTDKEKLQRLNSIVHPKVLKTIQDIAQQNSGIIFVETAILFESGLNRMVNAEWRIECPLELRIRRTMARNNLSREQVLSRINSQIELPALNEVIPQKVNIINDEKSSLLRQIDIALGDL